MATNAVNFLVPIEGDARKSNQKISGGNLIVESIADYLVRVPYETRSAGMKVTIISPAGIYALNNLGIARKNFTQKEYQFGADPTDASFKEVADAGTLVTNAVKTAADDAATKSSQAQTAAQEYVDLKIKGITTSSNVGSSVDNSAKFTVVVIPENIADIQNIQLEIPHFKFNKKLAYSLTRDDSHPATYRRDTKYINGQWVNDDFYILDSENRGVGSYPSRILCSTDGCGNDVRFRVTAACVTLWNADGTFKGPGASSKQYLNPTELVPFSDFFWRYYESRWGYIR